MSARNRELFGLIPVALLITAGFTAVFTARSSEVGDLSLIFGGYFLAICFVTHMVIRFRLPNADPYLFPLMALLAAIGLVMIYRIDDSLARDQANWFVLGLIVFIATITFLRDYQVLERYRYVIALVSLGLLLMPRMPLIGSQVNGAYLGVDIGPLAFQPAELAKIGVVIFLASYLRDRREVMIVGARKFMGLVLPPLKHLGPLLVVWGAAMLMLVFIRDLGSSLMFFGAFLALIYVATNRFSFVLIGFVMFLAGAWFFASTVGHVQDRVDIWLDPYADPEGAGFQVLQSMFAQADGGLFGQGIGASLLIQADGSPLIPEVQTDLIYALIVDELGLFGGAAVVLTYVLIAARGFKTAVLADDGFSKLLAAGLTAVFALQAFVIIGGVTRVIPLTGVTLPFVSYGGSSVVANMILLALLLLISERARRPRAGSGRVNPPIIRLYAGLLVLFALLVGFTSNWAVFDAEELEARTENKRPLLEQQKVKRGQIRSADGELLAISKGRGRGEKKVFVREYPTGELFGHPVGYDFVDRGRTGIEQSENDVLVGEENEFATIIEQLSGSTEEGSDLTITIDAGAQRLATDLLNAQGPGALVALEPATGAVRAMVSTPGYDPNEIPSRLDEFNSLPDDVPSVLLNRATQGRYAPGSTMKVVTAAAALDSGEFEPESVVDGTDGVEISGVPLQNSGNFSQSQITLTDALTNSVNTAWAQVAEDLGEDTMVSYMERFGFFKLPPLDYPDQQMTASGPRKTNGRLTRSGFDVGRVAIGQGGAEGQMQATPLQIAMIAATVANEGRLMESTFLQQVTDPDGRVSDELDPDEVRQVISEETAAELTEMMTNVTQEGTASNLTITGTDVFAGKTGTAERDLQGLNQAWFMMFAPADDPQIAIAATVESCQGCFGGSTAGPIATAVAEELLGG